MNVSWDRRVGITFEAVIDAYDVYLKFAPLVQEGACKIHFSVPSL